MRLTALALIFFIIGALIACEDEKESSDGDAVGLANPAAVFCVEQGGQSEIRTAADGSQTGMCILPDGTEVDDWDYYREHHPEAESD